MNGTDQFAVKASDSNVIINGIDQIEFNSIELPYIPIIRSDKWSQPVINKTNLMDTS